MATSGVLSIKLRCASWQQLAAIYQRDLSQGTMFLKASQPPTIGTPIRIDLTLPSASVIELSGVIEQHVRDQRGAGVELRLAPISAASIWMIESALAAEQRRGGAAPARAAPAPIPSVKDGEDVANAEADLVLALIAEVEPLRKLDPFLVLGVGHDAGDAEVREAFGALTGRYHPDRFARYDSSELRRAAAEIFLLIRDAYRRLCDEDGRARELAALGREPLSAEPPPPRRAPPGSPPEVRALLALEDLLDEERFDEALAGYKELAERFPEERAARAGIELCEGLLELGVPDPAKAAQRFEAALELEPTNERATRALADLRRQATQEREGRALADLRRQATQERKGLLSRLMGKAEGRPEGKIEGKPEGKER
jgi:curved DNA-binding protein CbpA